MIVIDFDLHCLRCPQRRPTSMKWLKAAMGLPYSDRNQLVCERLKERELRNRVRPARLAIRRKIEAWRALWR